MAHHSNDTLRPKRIAALTGVIGLIALALGLWQLGNERHFAAGAMALEGEVVQVKTHQSSGTTYYTPTFAFTDENGMRHSAPSAQGSKNYGFAIGAHMPILFNPEQPETVQVHNGSESSTGLKILFVSGFFLAIATLAFILHRRWKAAMPDYEARTLLPEDEEASWRYAGWLLRKPRKMALILGGLGGFLMIAGVSTLMADATFMKTALPTTAIVVSVEQTGSDFRPTVGFKTRSGAKVNARSAMSDSSYNFSTGQQVPIYYNPANPEDIRLQGTLEDGTFAYAVTFFALILLGLALYALSIHRSYTKERARRAALPKKADVVHSYSSHAKD
jgi:cbb3-type cytochrome oxidase subunit 3